MSRRQLLTSALPAVATVGPSGLFASRALAEDLSGQPAAVPNTISALAVPGNPPSTRSISPRLTELKREYDKARACLAERERALAAFGKDYHAPGYKDADKEWDAALHHAEEIARAIIGEPVTTAADLRLKLEVGAGILVRFDDLADGDVSDRSGWIDRLAPRLVLDTMRHFGLPIPPADC